ncbi:hypothetical protein PTSG_09408 [Salpingoeca rosetta]|uniref:Uncharacterized protein n=1 Tax=Salpingoeca rosetta (strain ATCC 50818 / BSB-021) TaxID=946362 RepID=F2UMJ3_SALR5|nr:uncharacterized protein PTSG_09408 [Salpingoeca rosetta]EGD78342.1 hypothetical protein PTSG_09408 [Salpingoeca rosetta]|eukprot:XP_004989665.1 hypothetical protein PTSG_09408 [Salpingoeca rosetta]
MAYNSSSSGDVLELGAIVCVCTCSSKASALDTQPQASPPLKRPSSLSLADFHVLVMEQGDSFGLPEGPNYQGEALTACATRIAQRYAQHGLRKPVSVTIMGHANRLKKYGGAAVAFLVPCTDPGSLQLQAGIKLIPMPQAVELAQDNKFMADYNETVLALAGFFKDKMKQPEEAQRMFSGVHKYPLQQQMNPLFLQPNMHLRDACFRSWTNPHFKTGALRPKQTAPATATSTTARKHAERLNDVRFNRQRSSVYEVEGADRSDVDDDPRHDGNSSSSSSSGDNERDDGGDDGIGNRGVGAPGTRGDEHSTDTSANNTTRASTLSQQQPGASAFTFPSLHNGSVRQRKSSRAVRNTSDSSFDPMRDDLDSDFTNPLYEASSPL